MKQNSNSNQIPQITNQQRQPNQNINPYPIQNQQHILDQDIKNNSNQNPSPQMNQMPMNQMPMNQMPMNQMPMGQMPMGQMPMGQMVYPNGMMQQPMMPMPVMFPTYPMMGLPNCVKCHGSGYKPSGGRCPCIGGRSDSEEFEDNLAFGLAFTGYRFMYPYYGYRGFY